MESFSVVTTDSDSDKMARLAALQDRKNTSTSQLSQRAMDRMELEQVEKRLRGLPECRV